MLHEWDTTVSTTTTTFGHGSCSYCCSHSQFSVQQAVNDCNIEYSPTRNWLYRVSGASVTGPSQVRQCLNWIVGMVTITGVLYALSELKELA
jgi:hypothetical protein